MPCNLSMVHDTIVPPLSLSLSLSCSVELSMSSFNSLQSARVGDLCCALYSEDQRWYRARVVELHMDRKVKNIRGNRETPVKWQGPQVQVLCLGYLKVT